MSDDESRRVTTNARDVDPWLAPIAAWLEKRLGGHDCYAITQILEGAVSRRRHEQSRADEKRLKAIMLALGWTWEECHWPANAKRQQTTFWGWHAPRENSAK